MSTDTEAFRGSSMVEQAAVNRKVEGSSPSLGAIFYGFSCTLKGREPERAENSCEVFCAEPCASTSVADSACEASVSPSLGAIFYGFSCTLKGREPENVEKVLFCAGMAELADAQDLKSCDPYRSYRFDPGFRHQIISCRTENGRYLPGKQHNNIILISRGRAVGSSSGS